MTRPFAVADDDDNRHVQLFQSSRLGRMAAAAAMANERAANSQLARPLCLVCGPKSLLALRSILFGVSESGRANNIASV
jgi:hypothetical protein